MAYQSYQKPPIAYQQYELVGQQELNQQQSSHPQFHDTSPPLTAYAPQPSFSSSGPLARRNFRHTVWAHVPILIALPLGTAGAVACFGFTYWLSQQRFSCPSWSLYCEVPPNVRWMALHMGQVQGFVSALYGAFISMIAYVAYKLAETTLWPAMTRRTFRLGDIDKFLETARGSLPALPQALWHSMRGGSYHALTVLMAGCLAILLFFNSVFVGHAYTLELVPTRYLSNFTSGGGMGFGFNQINPPGSFPVSIGAANAVYTSWANNMSSEPLPDIRNFILDRRALSPIGNTSVNAIKATTKVNCSAFPIRITKDVSWTQRLGDVSFMVSTNIHDSGDSDDDDYYTLNNDYDEDGYRDVTLRAEPYMAVWVDQYYNTSLTGAVTRLVFAAINGTIEGAHHTPPSKMMQRVDSKSTGIDTLACDVNIDLSDSVACVGPCSDTANSTLSAIKLVASPNSYNPPPLGNTVWAIAVWLGAVPSTFGTSVYGTQPLFYQGPLLNNSFSLPVSYTSTTTTASLHWTQANLTNFINVASGALGITASSPFDVGSPANVTVESTINMPRLNTSKVWVILIPIGVSLAAVVLIAILSVLSYRAAGVQDVRLGGSSDIVVAAQTGAMRSMVDKVRAGAADIAAVDEMQLRYGIVPDGNDGFGVKGEVRPFRDR